MTGKGYVPDDGNMSSASIIKDENMWNFNGFIDGRALLHYTKNTDGDSVNLPFTKKDNIHYIGYLVMNVKGQKKAEVYFQEPLGDFVGSFVYKNMSIIEMLKKSEEMVKKEYKKKLKRGFNKSFLDLNDLTDDSF